MTHQFAAYAKLLAEWDAKFNLTAVPPEDYAERHFADSLAPLKFYDLQFWAHKRVLDVGSGAGFPGVPLRLELPQIELTLLEAEEKRCAFLHTLSDELSLNAAILDGRAEELAHDAELRGAFDVVVSRAVAPLHALCEICLPFVGDEGVFIAWKSDDTEREAARDVVQKLSAEYVTTHTYQNGGVSRALLVYRKLGDTPPRYPRRWSAIKRGKT